MAGIAVPQQTPKRDTLGELLQGLQLAATSFGIYKDYSSLQNQKEQLDMMKADEQRKIEAAAGKAKAEAAVSGGFLDIPGQSKLKQEGWREATEGAPNAVAFDVLQLGGGTKKGFFLPPMSKGEEFTANDKKAKLDKQLADEKDKKTQENTLRKEYFDDDTTKSTRNVVEGYDKIKSLITSNRTGGPNDVAIIYAWAKMQDPGGRVTDSDFSAGQNLSGPVAKVRNYFDYVLQGQQIRPEDKIKILQEAKDIYKSQLENQNDVDEYYRGLAEHYGVNTKGVISDRYKSRYDAMKNEVPSTGTVLNKNQRTGLPFEEKAQASPIAQPFDIDSYLQRQQ